MSTQYDTARELRELHEAYIEKVNSALAEDREDLMRELVDGYAEQATRLSAGPPQAAVTRVRMRLLDKRFGRRHGA